MSGSSGSSFSIKNVLDIDSYYLANSQIEPADLSVFDSFTHMTQQEVVLLVDNDE